MARRACRVPMERCALLTYDKHERQLLLEIVTRRGSRSRAAKIGLAESETRKPTATRIIFITFFYLDFLNDSMNEWRESSFSFGIGAWRVGRACARACIPFFSPRSEIAAISVHGTVVIACRTREHGQLAVHAPIGRCTSPRCCRARVPVSQRTRKRNPPPAPHACVYLTICVFKLPCAPAVSACSEKGRAPGQRRSRAGIGGQVSGRRPPSRCSTAPCRPRR